MEALHFSISGEFITKIARNFVIEDKWEKALNMLKDDIQGCNYDIAVSILNGKEKFQGINHLELVDEDQTNEDVIEYKNMLKRKFVGVCTDSNEYWKPYAIVNGWCKLDLNTKFMTINKYNSYDETSVPTKNAGGRYYRWSMARNNFYMSDPPNDIAKQLKINKDDQITLWEKIRMPPLWLQKRNSWQNALDEYLDIYELTKTGASDFMDEITQDDYEDNNEYLKRKREIVDNWAEIEEKRYEENYSKAAEYVNSVNFKESMDANNGWMCPKGKIYAIQYSEHEWFAHVIIKERYNKDIDDDLSTPLAGDVLIKLGWQKLQRNKWPTLFLNDYMVTQSQYDTIYEYSKKHKVKMPSEIEVK